MVKRRAVAATVVCSLVFASILASNSMVLDVYQQRAGYLHLANQENRIHDEAMVLMGVAGAELMLKAAHALTSDSFRCVGYGHDLSARLDGLAVSLSEGGIRVTGTISVRNQGDVGDNLTLMHPLEGGTASGLDLLFRTRAFGDYGGGEVTLDRAEEHVLHFSFNPDSAPSMCVRLVQRLGPLFAETKFTTCNEAEVNAFAGRVHSVLHRSLMATGLAARASITKVDGVPCELRAEIEVDQRFVLGAAETFTWRVSQTIVLQKTVTEAGRA